MIWNFMIQVLPFLNNAIDLNVLDGSRFLGLFWKEKLCLIPKKYITKEIRYLCFCSNGQTGEARCPRECLLFMEFVCIFIWIIQFAYFYASHDSSFSLSGYARNKFEWILWSRYIWILIRHIVYKLWHCSRVWGCALYVLYFEINYCKKS